MPKTADFIGGFYLYIISNIKILYNKILIIPFTILKTNAILIKNNKNLKGWFFMEKYLLLIIYISLSLLAATIIVLSIIIYNNKCNRNLKERCLVFSRYLNIDFDMNSSNKEFNSFKLVLSHTFSLLNTYFRYQLIYKVFGITSLLFGAISFVTIPESYKICLIICCILSMLSVITVIYINPMDRARDYLAASRMWNTYSYELLTSIMKSESEFNKALLKLPDKFQLENELLNCDKI